MIFMPSSLANAIAASDLSGSTYAAVVVCDLSKKHNQKIMTASGRKSGWWRDCPKADVLVCLCHHGNGDRTVRAGRIVKRSGEKGELEFYVDRFQTLAVVPRIGISVWCGKQIQAVTIGIPLVDFQKVDFTKRLRKSLSVTVAELRRRVANASPTPVRTQSVTSGFARNPDVVALALLKAEGQCQAPLCGGSMPFIDANTGFPFLEVHHKVPLARGGADDEQNTEALCPNCHRREHFRLR